MFTAWLRRVFRGVTEPLGRFLTRLGISANALTIIGCLLNIAVAVVIGSGNLRLGGVFLALASSLDGLDGAIARASGQPTQFGAFLDSVLDRVSEAATLLGLAWWYLGQSDRIATILVFVVVVGSFLVSYTRARAEALGVDCKVGLLTRVERCIVLVLALVLELTYPALWLLAIGTVFTAAQRIVCVARKTLDKPILA